ncbi:MAG TPA: hypothetical protein PKX28_04530 [Candidatus Hydrogenedentes bacterium]|nr:hypothetical protein [Candidatus Hydrogenedentota bacterium]HOJ68094.1 hypothetical protein [Candidatus Hydrogenedentota bacterium]HOK90222.1 hypothetical protein [Candidatus Hydrogenedentota bacterium]HOV60247.1 hypothetical protein [Candidatus Hydrogenedentota bacterium]HPO30483.1 hypothetical protein [Candidatus Hydrogenedentota bacterium]
MKNEDKRISRHSLDGMDQELLSAWLDGEVPDRAEVDRLLKTSPEARAYLDQLQRARALYHAGRQHLADGSDERVTGVLDRIRQDRATPGMVIPGSTGRSPLPWRVVTAAAVVLILAGGGLFLRQILTLPATSPVEQTASVPDPMENDPPRDTVITGFPLGDLADSATLSDLLETLPEEEVLRYAALWDIETETPEPVDDPGLWWEQAERLAAFFEDSEIGYPVSPDPQP